MFQRFLALFSCSLVLLIITACATPYQPQGFRGRYSDLQLDAKTFRVDFNGNGFTSRRTVETYLLYRCAEVTVDRGYDYFIIVDRSSEMKTEGYTTPGSFQANTYGGYTSGTYTPGQTYTYRKHGGTMIIKSFRGTKPSDNPAAFDARELMGYLSGQVQKP